MKILYVEDEIPHVELTQRTLEDNLKQSFVLLHCESYKGALKLLEEEPDIDIVLTDLRLPDGSGLDLLNKIMEMDVPPAVVLVTGQGDEQVAVSALKAGAADYLVKQTDYLHRLPVVISNAVAQNNLTREQEAKRQVEVRYQSLIEKTPAVVFLDKTDEYDTAIYTSPRIEGLTGYTVEEWNADSFIWEDHIHPDDKERISEANRISHQESTRFEEEYRFIRLDGQTIWIKEDTNLIRDKDGNPLYWQGIMIDITKDKDNAAVLERQLKELTVLNAVTQAGAEGASEDEIIERVVNLTALIFNEVAGVLLLNELGNTLTPHPSYRGANVSNWQNGTPISEGITGKCVSEGSVIRLGDITSDPAFIEIATGIRSELCVPIRVTKRIIGVFNVESSKLNAYDNEDEQFLTTVAGSLGTALERLRLFNQEQQRNKELNALYQSTKSLTQSLEPEVIAESLLSIMDELLGYEFASIYLLDEQQGNLIPLAISPKAKNLDIYEKDMELLYTERRRLGQGIIGWVAKHGKSIRSGNVSADERYLPIIKNIQSELCVPLTARDKVIGAINIETTKLNAYTKSDENLLTALANSAAIALENAQLYEAVDIRRQEAESLQEATAALSIHIEVEPLLDQILASALKIVPYDSASIFLEDKPDNNMEIVAVRGFPDEIIGRIVPKSAKWHEPALTHKALILTDAQADPIFEKWDVSEKIRGWMGVPMISQDKVVGFINFDSHTINAYKERDATLVQTFANSAAVAIQNTRLYSETQQSLKELETINRLSSSARTTQSQSEMCRILLDESLRLLDSRNGSVWIYDSGTNMNVQRAARGVAAKVLFTKLKPGDGIVGHVMSTGKHHITVEMKSDPLLYENNRDATLDGFGAACIPIYSTDGILGVLIVQIESNRRVEDHIGLLATLAEIAGNAIHRADLFDQSQDQVHKLTTLRDIDSAIASSTDLRVTLSIVMDHTIKHLKVDAVDILLYHRELQSLSYLCGSGFKTPSSSRPLMRIGEGLAGQVVMKGQIVQIPDLQETTEIARNPLLAREGFISYIGIPLIVKGQIKGLFEIFHRSELSPDHEWMEFMQTLTGQAAIAIDNSQLFDNLQRSNQEIRQAYDTTLEGWARALELRDRETEGHTRRVTEMTMRLTLYMNISEEELVNINRGVLLHDIGKMGVPDQILRKTGPLTDTEWVEMRQHPQYAYDLLSPILYLRPALDIPYCHHEHWDGSGYPRGLKNTQIPLSARIFSIVDIWDALLSDRPYRKAWPRDKVIEYIKEISGKILDPQIVTAFLDMIGEEENKMGL